MSGTSSDVIWALDQRERCIACPSAPVANAVVLHLGEDGSLARDAVGSLAARGVMAAGVAWPGAGMPLSEEDWLDLEDAVSGLVGLASAVAVVGEGRAAHVARELSIRGEACAHSGDAADPRLIAELRRVAPI